MEYRCTLLTRLSPLLVSVNPPVLLDLGLVFLEALILPAESKQSKREDIKRSVQMSRAAAFTVHPSFTSLVSQYDGFILDQFGVIHNGSAALEGSIELMEHLAREEKKLIVLSNTSQPSSAALEKLPNYGFNINHLVGAVTSGEEASHFIRKEFGDKPRRAMWLTWKEESPGSTQFLKQCGNNISLANSVDEADFVIAHGSQVWRRGDGSVSSLGDFMMNCLV